MHEKEILSVAIIWIVVVGAALVWNIREHRLSKEQIP